MPILLRHYINRQTLISAKNLLRSYQHSLASLFNTTMNQQRDQQSPPSSPSTSSDPPPFDPLRPSIPISYPLKTLEELETRAYFDSFHYPFNKSSVPLQLGEDSVVLPDRPRMLVCHDMAGGYTDDDKWVQGGVNPDAYAIWHWYLMDVFVYFSHSLVTIPPPCWTNAAHKHGVKVLGTFITEWDEGKAVCDKLLATRESARTYAELLAELAVALGFDGWLMNFEVSLDVSQIPNLIEFVSHLTQTMHSSMPGSLIIWYDSVTIKGDLSWQDQLNDLNKPFFDICDGIFVNYTWKKNYPKLSADVAGDRKFDVYMGIDVFGRNTYGGGQWTTNVALDVLKKDDVSAAIFAPGWVYETKQPPDFQTTQNRWWSLVEKSWGVMQNYPKALPFYTGFDQGHGYHFAVDGRKVSADPWCNISCQGLQPFLEFVEDPSPDTIQVHVDFKEASFNGGGNITFKGTLEDRKYFTAKLFMGELLLGDVPLDFTYSIKSDGTSLLGLSLYFSSSTNERKSVLLASHGRTLLTTERFSRKFSQVIIPHKVTTSDIPQGWIIQESRIAMSGYTLREIHAVCYKLEPEVSQSISGPYGQSNIFPRSPKDYFAVLGHMTVKNTQQYAEFPPSSSWLLDGRDIKWTSGSNGSKLLSVKLIWKLKKGSDSLFSKYNIYVEKHAIQTDTDSDEGLRNVVVHEYLGVAQVEAFYISNLSVPSGISIVKFITQVCGADGTCQKLNGCPYFQLDVEDNRSGMMKTQNVSLGRVGSYKTPLAKLSSSNSCFVISLIWFVLAASFILFVLSFAAICLSFPSIM